MGQTFHFITFIFVLLMSYTCSSCSRSTSPSHWTPLSPGAQQVRATVVYTKAVPLLCWCITAWQPLPQRHPREEGFPATQPRRAPGWLLGGGYRGPQAEAERRAPIRWPQRLTSPGSAEVPVPLWRRYETAWSVGQWEASAGRQVWRGGFWCLQNLPDHREHPTRRVCQTLCLQISSEC